jgi:hypothetical protein
MAGCQDLLLAERVEDLRRKVFELAAIVGEPRARDPDTWLSSGAALPVRSIRGLGTGLAGPPNDRGALIGAAVGWPPGEEGFRAGAATETGYRAAPLGCCKRPPPAAFSEDPPKSAWIPQGTLGYAEKVRSQFLSLRQLLSSRDCYGAGRAENPAVKASFSKT